MYKGTKICQKPCRSEENILSYIFKVLKGKKNWQTRFYTQQIIFQKANYVFRQILREFTTGRSIL